jgi:hypothetical protein
MFTHRYPSFQKGRILKVGMLENLRDYPRSALELLYAAYSDGVLAGAEVCAKDGRLIISSGIVKREGRLYLMTSPYSLAYDATGRETLLKLRFEPVVTDSDFVIGETEAVLEEGTTLRGNELELARFKLKEGARLRSGYQSFSDMATEYNTLNIVHGCYAGLGQPTLAPELLRYFSSELLKTGTSNPYDIAFAMQSLNAERVSREVILLYVCNRTGGGYKEYTNGQLHRLLAKILDEAGGSGGMGRPELRRGGPQKMIVD